MSVNNKVKALLALNNETIKSYAKFTNRTQANVSNKISRNSWNVQDFLKLAEFTNCNLAFLNKDGNPIIVFEDEDIEKKD